MFAPEKVLELHLGVIFHKISSVQTKSHITFLTLQLLFLVTPLAKYTCQHTCLDGTGQFLQPSQSVPLTLLAALPVQLNAVCLNGCCSDVPACSLYWPITMAM